MGHSYIDILIKLNFLHIRQILLIKNEIFKNKTLEIKLVWKQISEFHFDGFSI